MSITSSGEKPLMRAALDAIKSGMVSMAILFATLIPALAQDEAPVIAYEKFTLDNGLRVIVHEDRKAPIVAINVWYGVGSRDEPKGRSGFAHLFEHLMYNGTENYDDEFFGPLETVGATQVNGNTWFDRTVYYETVPTPALPLALWMESDRMGHLLNAVTQEKLDEQRGVVQNEKRQGDNQPYGLMEYRVLEGLFPEGHPYRHSTIGSMEDLDAASLEDVHGWFKRYYGAANAVLVLAGDINAEEARPLVEKYFADIPAGPPLQKWRSWVPEHQRNTAEVLYDQVPQARLSRNWATPGRTEKERAYLSLSASILGGGKASRLYQKLVQDEQIATQASAYLSPHKLASFFSVEADLAAGGSMDRLIAETDAVLEDFLARGPTQDELERAKARFNAGLIRGLETVGDDDGKAGILGKGELYAGDPHFYLTLFEWVNDATVEDVRLAAEKWLSSGHHQIEVLPYAQYATTETDADRSKLPYPSSSPDLQFPAVESFSLQNGVKVYLAKRSAVPVVETAIVFDAGYASDAPDSIGVSSFTLSMLDEGTRKRSSLEIASDAGRLGASISTSSNTDLSVVSVSALKSSLPDSYDLFADIVRNSNFPQDEIDKLKVKWLSQIEQEKAQPVQLALRLLPPLLYGDGHPYGVPFTGSGNAHTIKTLTRDQLVAFKEKWLGAHNASIYIAGDVDADEVRPLLEKSFGAWRTDTPKPQKNFQAPLEGRARVILIDKPNSPQSVILAGILAPSATDPQAVAIDAMNDIIGGQFSSRINMNLREDKSWAYGAYTFMSSAAGPRPFFAYAPVQSDKTAESIMELRREMKSFLSDQPARQDELTRVVDNSIRSLPGQYETSTAVLGSMITSRRFERPFNYPETLKGAFENLSLEEVRSVARRVIKPDDFIWVIVGDLKNIEHPIQDLGIGAVDVWTLDGEPVE